MALGADLRGNSPPGLDILCCPHRKARSEKAVVEAFPSTFLGVMLEDPEAVLARRGDRSDVFFQHLAATGGLQRLLAHLLPGRSLTQPLAVVTNHDDRAGLVCALTALAVAAGQFTAVGDADGWIILPPKPFLQGWAWVDLQANAAEDALGTLYVPGPPDLS